MHRYRSLSERRDLCRAVLRELPEDELLRTYDLTLAELALYRGLASRVERRVISRSHVVRRFASARFRQPLRLLAGVATAAIVICIALIVYLGFQVRADDQKTYPLLAAIAALVGVIVATFGWAFNSWLSYRNSKKQHTVNLIFQTRFTQPSFNLHMRRFNKRFPILTEQAVTLDIVDRLDNSDDDDEIDLSQSIKFILNYFEFIAAGVIEGDLDLDLVEQTVLSNLIYYFDKSAPYVYAVAKRYPGALENLIALRDHYREP